MNLRNLEAIFVENSRVPKILSFFAPIDINAITLGPLVFSSGEVSEVTRNHENIHLQQYIELGFVFFPLVYVLYYIFALKKYGSGSEAYRAIPFEQEAYSNEEDFEYNSKRKRYAWLKYGI